MGRSCVERCKEVALITILIAVVAVYAWGDISKPLVTYELSSFATPYRCALKSPAEIILSIDNEGGIVIRSDFTLTVENATVSNSTTGQFAHSSTQQMLIHSKTKSYTKFYVVPDNNVPSFKVSIDYPQTVSGSEPLFNFIYFVYASSIYQPVNVQSLTYAATNTNPNYCVYQPT
jgi:hypothetical protein